MAETTLKSSCANFHLKSEAKKFDGPTVGVGPCTELFVGYESERYDALSGSSGNNGGGVAISEKDIKLLWGRAGQRN